MTLDVKLKHALIEAYKTGFKAGLILAAREVLCLGVDDPADVSEAILDLRIPADDVDNLKKEIG